MQDKPKVILTEDHELFRAGIKLILTREGIADVIAEASDGLEVIELIKKGLKPDVIFMDISMPKMNGIDATKALMKIDSGLRIIAFTMYDDMGYFSMMIDAGVRGFIMKTTTVVELRFAIKELINDRVYFSQDLLSKYLSMSLKNNAKIVDNKTSQILSDREKRVLVLICEGNNNDSIAEFLSVSPNTVKAYRSKILEKTGCNNTASLVMYAIKNGFITI